MLHVKKESKVTKDLIPLKQVSVDVHIHSFAADVILTQLFENNESVPIEAVYCFPIEENAAIYSFVAKIDDEREIVAEIKEKKEAQKEYSQALAEGHGAYLFEQDEKSNDIFIISIGALKPNSECRIKMSYVTELDLLHGNDKPMIRFVIPTTIAPRYSPEHKGISSPGETQVQYTKSVPYTIDLQCHVDRLNENISGISSPSHPIKIDLDNPDSFLIQFSQQGIQLDRDIILDIELSQMKTNTIAAIGKDALMVSFMPNEHDCQQKINNTINEFLFVIDCSGSMRGDDKIGLACKAMILFLKSLPMNCYFNIIRFGSTYASLFDNEISVEYNEKTMNQAELLIKNMSADLGGTELFEPLTWLMKNKPKNGSTRQVFLLTDGEVSNVDQITNICKDMSSFTRIFSFGLGHSPSHSLVKGLARATNGHFTFIPPSTNVDIHVAEQLARSLRPSLTNMNIKWKTNQTVLYSVSEHSSPVFVGDRLLFYVLLDQSIPFDDRTTIEITSREYQEPISIISIQHSLSSYNPQTITRLAAKAILQNLQHKSKNTPKEVYIDLSIKYGILCPHTAFIGIEKRLNVDNESNADMTLREVSILAGPEAKNILPQPQLGRATMGSLQSQVDSVFDTMKQNISLDLSRDARLSSLEMGADALSCGAHAYYKTADRKKGLSIDFGSVFQPVTNYISSLFTKKSTDSEVNTKSATTRIHHSLEQTLVVDWPTDEQQLVERFIDRQQYDGLWNLTDDDVMKLTKKSIGDFSSSLFDTIEKKNQKLIITTILTMVLLEKRCMSKKTLWQALSNKAQKRILELLSGDQNRFEQLIQHIRHQI